MVYIPPELVIGGVQAIAGIIGANAKDQQRRAADEAANRASLRSYAADVSQYRRSIDYQTRLYDQEKQQYQQQLQFNNQFLAESYNQSQLNLSNYLDQLSSKNLNSLVKYYQTSGAMAAKGMTGNTADRISAMNAAALGRLQSTREASYEAAKGERINRDRIARMRTDNLNQNAYARVAVPPSFAGPPVFAGNQQTASSFGGDVFNSVLGGVSTAFSGSWNPFIKPPSNTGNPVKGFAGSGNFIDDFPGMDFDYD